MRADKAAKGGRTQRQKEPTSGSPPSGNETAGGHQALGKDIQAQIGQQLRAVYDDVLKEDVPDRFMKLLAELDARTGGTPPVGDERDEGGEKQ